MEMKILVTGSAGFIGNALVEVLLQDGHEVIGVDNFNQYYARDLKYARDARLKGFNSQGIDITSRPVLEVLFRNEKFDCVVHLAAQAGVRYSITHPQVYIDSNITGFLNILECCRKFEVGQLLYASSSSVYGNNINLPFRETDTTDKPANLYAATKKMNEHMAETYRHLYGMRAIGMRFFTAYGPWGRPDMALFMFVKSILAGEPIELFNGGNHARDFTYISDIVAGIKVLLDYQGDGKSYPEEWNIFNIGSGRPIPLRDFVHAIENALGLSSQCNLLPLQPGDVETTHADIERLKILGYQPQVSIENGVERFVDWYTKEWGK